MLDISHRSMILITIKKISIYFDKMKKLPVEYYRYFSELIKYEESFVLFCSQFQVDISTISATVQMEVFEIQSNR